MTAYQRLVAAGFSTEQANALALAGFDVLGVWPLGWVALPLDEHLAHVGGAA